MVAVFWTNNDSSVCRAMTARTAKLPRIDVTPTDSDTNAATRPP